MPPVRTKIGNNLRTSLMHYKLYAYSKHYGYFVGRILASIQVPHPEDREYYKMDRYLVDRSWINGPGKGDKNIVMAEDVEVIDIEDPKNKTYDIDAHMNAAVKKSLYARDRFLEKNGKLPQPSK